MSLVYQLVHTKPDKSVSYMPTYMRGESNISGSWIGPNGHAQASNIIVGYSGRNSNISTDNSVKVYGSGVLNLTDNKLVNKSVIEPLTRKNNK